MSWDCVKLEELYAVHNGLSKGGKYFGSGYPFLTFSTVFNNYFIPEDITDLVQSSEAERANYSIQRGDVFVTRTSETANELGMSCVALRDYPQATYNGFTKRMRPMTDKVLPEYIGYYMRMPSFRGNFQAFSTMTTRASLRNEDLLSLEIALPDIQTQEKIANILLTYDNLIKNNKKQFKLLEEAAQRLYKEWFTGTDVCDLDNTTLSEIVTFKRGKTITKAQTIEGNIPVVAGGLEPAYYHNEANTTAPVITVSGSGANAGFARMYFEDVFASDCSFADSGSTQYLFFVYCFLKENKSQLDALQKGSAQPHVYAKDINAMVMKSIPKQRLEQFCDIVKPYFEMMGNLEKRSKSAVEARDRLLPKLMNGEIEI